MTLTGLVPDILWSCYEGPFFVIVCYCFGNDLFCRPYLCVLLFW